MGFTSSRLGLQGRNGPPAQNRGAIHGTAIYPGIPARLAHGDNAGFLRYAQAAEQLQFDIPAQELKYALRTVTRRAGLELYATSSDLGGRTSPEVHGEMTAEEALDRLLAGTGLVARFKGKAVYIRVAGTCRRRRRGRSRRRTRSW
jgi:hypothetical protein